MLTSLPETLALGNNLELAGKCWEAREFPPPMWADDKETSERATGSCYLCVAIASMGLLPTWGTTKPDLASRDTVYDLAKSTSFLSPLSTTETKGARWLQYKVWDRSFIRSQCYTIAERFSSAALFWGVRVESTISHQNLQGHEKLSPDSLPVGTGR